MRPKGLKSPKKSFPRIPMTPHRQSTDAFWQQDVVNDWNDEYSPRKIAKSTFRLNLGEPIGLLDLQSPGKSPAKPTKAAKDAKKAFSLKKHALAQDFLNELDDKITQGEISRLAFETGGVKILWSKKLNTTAGRANWKRETIKTRLDDGRLAPPTYRHHAAIELAEKVIDDEHRLLNVLAHEFCHLANFMISGVKTNPHGKEFKAWAAQCSRLFAHRGIEVTTKHSYDIDYKYVWECENCGLEFKRHSKSIDPAKHRCGSCKSQLVQTKPVPRANPASTIADGTTSSSTITTTTTVKKVNEYQLFVKEHMKIVRKENPGSPQKEIMGLIGQRYQVYKAAKMEEEDERKKGARESAGVSVDEIAPSKESTPEDEDQRLGYVARKLDFFDLTKL